MLAMQVSGRGKLLSLACVQGLGYAATLGWNIIGARICSVHVYGVISLAVGLILALQVLVEMGHQRTLVRFLRRSEVGLADVDGRILRRRALVVPLSLGAFLGLGIVLVNNFARGLEWGGATVSEWFLIAPAGVGAALMNVQAGAYIAAGRAVASSVLSLSAVPTFICFAFLILDGMGQTGAGAMLGAIAIPYVVGGVFAAWKLLGVGQVEDISSVSNSPKYGGPNAKEFYSYAWKIMIVGLVSLGLGYVDRYILGAFASFAALGLYSLPARMARLLNTPIYFLNPLAGPAYARGYRSGRMNEALTIFMASSNFIGAIVLPIAIVAMVYAEPLLVWVGGQEYAAAASSMSVLVAGVLILTLSGNSSLLLQMAGREGAELRSGVMGLAANVLISMILLRPLGILGVAIGTAAGLAITAIARYMACRAAWGIALAMMIRPRLVLGGAAQFAIAIGASQFRMDWSLAAAVSVLTFSLISPPWVAFRELERALASADLVQHEP